jgi:NSS family neurotransmitter:Na+ symporter
VSAEKASRWSRPEAFVLAAAGVAIGLGNIWSLPQQVLLEGGGAFLVVYLVALACGALPMLLAELALGRRAGGAMTRALRASARSPLQASLWGLAGWLPVIAALVVVALLSVVGGWLLAYLTRALFGSLDALTPQAAISVFSALVTDPERSLAWHTLATVCVLGVLVRPLRKGLQLLAYVGVPAFFVVLLILFVKSASQPGFGEIATRLLWPDFSRLGVFGCWSAIKLAFFSLAAGLGAMAVCASYLPPSARLGRLALNVLLLDLLASLLALLALAPTVLAAGLNPGAGTQLLFERAPVAFGTLPEARLLLSLMYLLAFLAALTSMAGMAEAVLSPLVVLFGFSRRRAAATAATLWWLLGLAALLSFNLWSGTRLWGMDPYTLLEAAASNVLIPAAALLILVHAAWVLARDTDPAGIGLGRAGFALWRPAARYLAPLIAVALLLVGSGAIAELERLIL